MKKMTKLILAAFLAVAFVSSTSAFAEEGKEEKPAKKEKKTDKKKDESKTEKPAGGGW
jgi:ribosomal protein L12E/L44/L45/RPP1/RPP2